MATSRSVDVGDDVGDLLHLVAELTLQDIQDIQDGRKGKSRYNTVPTDEEIAFQLYAEEANGLLAFAGDAILARSIDDALKTDRGIIRQMVAMENVAFRDRQYALALSQGRAPPSTSPGPSSGPSSHESRTPRLTLDLTSNQPVTEARFVSKAGSSKSQNASSAEKFECIICMEKIRKTVVTAPCGHHYDLKCLIDLFRSTLTDESLFPPRCCQRPFIFDDVRHYFDEDLVTAFRKKAVEFSWEENRLLTAATDRVNRQIHQQPAAARPAGIADFNRLVARAAENLRTNHHCAHQYWQYRDGGGQYDPGLGIIEDLVLDPAQDNAVDPDDLRVVFTDLLFDVHTLLTDILFAHPVKMEDEDIDRIRAIGDCAVVLYDLTPQRLEETYTTMEDSASDGERRRRAARAPNIEPRGVASRRGSGDPGHVPGDPQISELSTINSINLSSMAQEAIARVEDILPLLSRSPPPSLKKKIHKPLANIQQEGL
ncbi:hypothetical protein EIP91_012295 [Steccherinum ochraceum]|uniref:RING-type domain-containing protein n=1 Tax=Steccherinum ochraceum TaxID=92696 RepID=A0A4R0RGX7_9APHY|nr:hypothetical protein EIP91_012295 [Steccherinum ochraceum]